MEVAGKIIQNLQMSKNASAAILFSVIFAVTYWMLQSRHPRRRLPPAIRSLPIIGSKPFLSEHNELPNFFMETSKRLKSNVFSYFQGTQYTIVLNGLETIKEALVKRSTDYADRMPSFTTQTLFAQDCRGIILSRYTEHFKRYHQLVLSILREYGFGQTIMEERIVAEVEALVNRIKSLKGKSFDPCEYLNVCTVNVINSIAFGQRCEQSHPTLKRMSNYYNFFMNCARRFVDFCPPLRFLPKYKSLLNEIVVRHEDQHQLLLEMVKENLKAETDSFVNRFAEIENGKFDVLELKEIISDLLFAGSETTATSVQWSIYYMANNPEIQKRIREEIDSVVPRDRFPSLNDKESLPYLEAAMLEFMRIRILLPLSVQRYTMCDTEAAGYFIPAKTRVTTNLYSVHMDPVEFPEPEVYRPERFLDSEGHVIGRNRIIPFSLGKRSCLGELLARQELFLLFATLVQRFHILPPEGQDQVQSKPKFVITLCPTPFLVRLVPIED